MATRINSSPLVKTYTLEEFWHLPDPPDRSKLELIAGVLFMTPPPEYTHDNVVERLDSLLREHLATQRARGKLFLPRAAIWTGENTYLEPDLFFISEELLARLDPAHRTTADVVFEVISPGSAIYDRNTKADTYEALGVRELWLVDPTEEVVEVRSRSGDQFDEGKFFRGGEIIESVVWRDLQLKAERLFHD
jgi:Uma2 family endonuclease